MATPPKRGRGRPPLTEAEKKKREKRAQKAKEEAAAKREKEREKKKQQMLNKRKSIRSQVSKKVKEQQELAITRSKMLSTGDLQSRIGDGEGQVLVAAVVGGGTVFQAIAPRIGRDGCFKVRFKLLAGVHSLSFGRLGSGIQNGILSGNDSARVIFTIPARSVLLYQTKMFPIESPSHL
jgi:hypothetical protein